MIRKILLLVALVVAVSAEAQIDTVLFESFKNRFSFEGKSRILSNEETGFEGWQFENCYAIKEDATKPSSDVWLQVGSTDIPGSVMTPAFYDIKGNARITNYLYTIDEDTKFCVIEKKNGVYTDWKYTIDIDEEKKNSWIRIPSILMRTPSKESQLIFFTNNKSGERVGRRFQIANILICDIGENIFYESFDKNNGVGGNDGIFSDGSSITPASYDNPTSTGFYDYAGNKCCLFKYGSSRYTTGILPLTSSEAILTFKVAGTEADDSHYVDISCTNATAATSRVNAIASTWKEVNVNLTSIGSNATIQLGGYGCFLDEIRVREVASDDLSMSQIDGSNSKLDDMTIGTVANVTLTRTLSTGIWNTLCLPFRFDNTMLSGENHILRLTSVTDGCYNFTEDDAVPAGEPFLLKVSSTAVNPTFNNVTIRTKSPGTKMFGDYGLRGIFFTKDLETDNSNAFLGTDGSLYYPAAETKAMNGLRAYFVKPSAASARVSFSVFEPAAIRELSSETIAHEYNLWGQRVSSSHRGIIIRNGKKVYRQ